MRLNCLHRAGFGTARPGPLLTPARGIAAVLVVAIAVLAISQFLDYREVRAGVPAYSGIESVAPAPLIAGTEASLGSAHAYLGLLLAAAAFVLVVAAMRGRWQLARLLLPIGLAVILISLLVDAPKGLDESAVAVQFEGAEARLLGPFWVQLFAGVVIAACGPLLALNLGREQPRPTGEGRSPARRSRARTATPSAPAAGSGGGSAGG